MINPSLEETDKKSTITTKGPLSHDQIAEDVPVITIDPRSLLEVADGMHRYGKNLRMYFREFTTTFPDFQPLHYHSFHEKLQSFQPFFTWLDKPGGRPSELKDCSFQALDSDRVEYLSCDEGRSPYKYHINQEGLLEHVLTHQLLTTQAKGDMFVLKDNFFYVNEKRTKTIPRFHHSSFFGGDFVNSAGIIIAEKGRIKVVFPHSGHYRPLDRHLLWLLLFLQSQTINLSTILVDAQRIFKVSRHADKENGPKSKKMDCVYLLPGNFVLDFLRAKFKSMDLGLLAEIKSFHDRNVSLKPIVQPVSSAPSSSSLVRAQVLETILLDGVETYQEREGKSISSTITQSHATPLPHSTKPPRRVTSTSYTFLSNEELLQVDRDLHLLLAESPAMNAVSRKIHLSSPPTSTPDAFHVLKERDSRDILSKPSLREIDLFDESSSRSDSSKRLCEFEDKMMSAPFSSMLHPVTANNTSSSDSVSHDCKPPTIIIPLLVSNSCFSRSTSTANLNILSSSSPVLN